MSRSWNRKLGYFDNTRTVLFLPALFGDGDYAASYVNREMNTIFRYPYYRKLDTEGYTGKAYSPSELPALAEQTGADIVVMPVISRCSRSSCTPCFLGWRCIH